MPKVSSTPMQVQDGGERDGAFRIGLKVAGNRFALMHTPDSTQFWIVSCTPMAIAEGTSLEQVLGRFAGFLRGDPIKVDLLPPLLVELVMPTWRTQVERWSASQHGDHHVAPDDRCDTAR